MHGHGSRRRQAIAAGAKQWCQVSRFFCSVCGKTFTRLPDFLLPFKHYVASEIEGVLRHVFEGGKLSRSCCGADESTLRRWLKEFTGKMGDWAGLLESRMLRLSQQVPSLVQRISHPLRRLEEILSGLPALPPKWTMLVQTLWWLQSSYPL